MTTALLRPSIASIPSSTWLTIKGDWKFWCILVFAVATIFFLGPFSLLLIIFYCLAIYKKVKNLFWKQTAEANGWQYKESASEIEGSGIMFQQGKRRSVGNLIEGNADNRPFSTFNYSFVTGEGKHQITHAYQVFSFAFNGSFPHLYLNNRHNSYNITVGEKIPLPFEFEKEFCLSAPKEYEIEALEIFTPDILSKILEGKYVHDVEFVDKRMLIFVEKDIGDFEKFEEEFRKASELRDIFSRTLDRFAFETIGDRPSTLDSRPGTITISLK